MQNKIDYIYEFSDLNLFQIRVHILTGHYKDVILEFGGSYVESWMQDDEEHHDFTFTYTIYEKPEGLMLVNGDKEFEQFLSNLLINIVQDKKNDKNDRFKLMEAASVRGIQN